MLSTNRLVAFVPTTDTAKARAFYEGTLGLRFIKDDGFALVFDANGVMLRVAKVGEHKPARFTILGWEVADIMTSARQLAAAGVRFELFGLPGQDPNGVWIAPSGERVAWFKDPDGNILSVSQHD